MDLGYLYRQGSPSAAFGVSADGSVVVGRSRNSTGNAADEAFCWTQATRVVGLSDLPGGENHVFAGDNSSDCSGASGWMSFYWTERSIRLRFGTLLLG
ncbi:MAG TPA: hypothetical protein VJZ71_16735 [Phycisphaerae bacterium]|nr:hypothetical protein [Phycisphaerae bacterium]